MLKQVLIFATWFALMAVSVGYAVRAPDMTSATGAAIAQLTERQGTVQYRQEGVTLWLDVGSKQSFSDGTLIATGAKSEATVAFRDGREIVLGESSQVVLTLGSDDADSVVTLLKGTLETINIKPQMATTSPNIAPRRLIINSGNKSVALANVDDRVTVAKEINIEAPNISLLGGIPMVAAPLFVNASLPILPIEKLALAAPEVTRAAPKPAPTEVAVVTEPTVEPDNVEPDIPKAPSVEPLNIKALRIVSPASGVRLWTTLSLQHEAGSALTVSLAADTELPTQDVDASLEVMRGNQSVHTLKVTKYGGRYLARLHGSTVLNSGKRERGLPAWTLSLKSRVSPRQGQEAKLIAAVDSKLQDVTLASLADFPKGSATVFIGKVAPKEGQGWIAQTGNVTAAQASAGVFLSDSAELPLLAPLLRGSGAFSFATTNVASKDGTQIVRDDKLAARVLPDTDGASIWVRRALDADLAFRGSFDSYVGSGVAIAQAKGSTKGWTNTEQLTAYDLNTRPVQLNTALFKRHDEAWSVLAKHARAVFTKPVILVDPPPRPARDARAEVAILRASYEKAGQGNAATTLGLPGRMIFVTGMEKSGEPRFRRMDHRKFNSLGIVTAASSGQSAFALNLNPKLKTRLSRVDRSTPAGLVEEAMLLAEADAVVLSPEGDTAWIIARSENGKLRQVASAPPPSRPNDAVAVHAWVIDTLGVTNRVLTKRGYAAMTLLPKTWKNGMQGLVVTKDGDATAIVELSEAEDQIGIITFLVGDDATTSMPTGARILWE